MDTRPKAEDTVVYFNRISARFFDTLGTSLVAGRDFNARDTLQSPKVAIVNQTMAKLFRRTKPLGKRYRTEDGNKLSDPSKSSASSRMRNTGACARNPPHRVLPHHPGATRSPPAPLR